VVHEYERRRWEAIKADRALIDRAAAHLRHEAIRSEYAGLQHKHVAFALAMVLDELARHLGGLDEAVRWQAVEASKQLLGRPMDHPTRRRTRGR
jgi:hypothetical protein